MAHSVSLLNIVANQEANCLLTNLDIRDFP